GEPPATRCGRLRAPSEVAGAALYPRVLDEYFAFRTRYGDVSALDTPSYFYGLEPGEEIWVELEEGKTIVIRFDAVSEAAEDGSRTVFFTLNGQARPLAVVDRSLGRTAATGRQADPANPDHLAAPMPGKVIAINAKAGDAVREGDPLVTLEAMKMENVVRAPHAGTVAELLAVEGASVAGGELLAVIGAA